MKNEKGIALLVVLWVLILLWVIVGEFSYAVKLRLNIVNNFKDSTQSYYFAVTGINNALAMLLKRESEKAEPVRENFLRNIESDIHSERANGDYSVRIGNESGKVNINTAEENLLRVLFNAVDNTDTVQVNIIVDSILDWRDENNLHRINGAEDDYYLSLDPPYECRDGEFRSKAELLLVRGVSQQKFADIEDMITLYTESDAQQSSLFTRNLSKNTSNKININFAPKQLLRSLPMMTDELADEIIARRNEKLFQNLNALQAALGAEIYAAVNQYLTVSVSSFYSMIAYGFTENNRSKSVIDAIIEIDKEFENGYRFVQWKEE
ncbi:MAG: type II secretion system protein GspK [Desulfobacteraceae bacterium]|jgi:general secretion pathway protein K|nr:type II secretion system protein GspK [Desulfobacteraceae bacterium]